MSAVYLREFLLERILEEGADAEWKLRIFFAATDLQTAIVRGISPTSRPAFGEFTVTTGDHLFRLLALPYAEHPDYREEWRA